MLNKIQGSTLVETVVSLTILAIVFFVSISIALNAMWFSKPNLKLQAFNMTRLVLNQSISNSDYSSDRIQKQKLLLLKEPEELPNGLVNLKISVWYNDSTLILETNELVCVNE